VTWIGSAIAGADRLLNLDAFSHDTRRVLGLVSIAALLALVATAAVGLQMALHRLLPWPWSLGLIALAASSLIAQKSLHEHVARVADALDQGLEAGREAVAHIVGRDPQTLDEAGVARAAIESLAENYSDGVLAPVLYLAVAGIPGAALYKAVNTADSMIGHRTERHEAFGWAAAKLDDLVNLPASRLAAGFLILAAAVVPGGNAMEAARAVFRDAHRHRSPNAGWPEAAMAGALGLRLAGPRVYGGVPVPDHWMGRGRPQADSADIRQALRIYRAACLLQVAALAMLMAALRAV